jgi:LAO/AO transport system kinase
MHPLATRVLAGERLALARALTHVENDTSTGRELLQDLFSYTGKAHIIGITGAPGTGKSSLVNRLALQTGKRTGIIAVDPTSPFSGGALLGDRVRMADLAGKPNIFIRSMASRGALGGLGRMTSKAVQLFEAAGYDLIMIETVGAGQAEVEIARQAHTVIVVEAPGLGDDIQANKAGILEIADILIVNKADLPGADQTARFLRSMLEVGKELIQDESGGGQTLEALHHLNISEKSEKSPRTGWVVPVLMTVASSGEGIAQVWQSILDHGEYLRTSLGWERFEADRLARELEQEIKIQLVEQWRADLPKGLWENILVQLQKKEISPSQAISLLMASPGAPGTMAFSNSARQPNSTCSKTIG